MVLLETVSGFPGASGGCNARLNSRGTGDRARNRSFGRSQRHGAHNVPANSNRANSRGASTRGQSRGATGAAKEIQLRPEQVAQPTERNTPASSFVDKDAKGAAEVETAEDEDFECYEEISSLSGEDSWPGDFKDEGVEAAHYVTMAMTFAKRAVEATNQEDENNEDDADSEDEEVEQIRFETKNSLVQAVGDGRLADALSELRASKEDLRSDAQSTLLMATVDGSLAAAIAAVKDSKMRSMARQTLLQAGGSDRLREALRQVKMDGLRQRQKEETEKQQRKPEQKNNLGGDALRLKLRDMFTNANTQGHLDEIIVKAQEARASQTRQTAKTTLLHSVADGRLSDALRRVKEEKAERAAEEFRQRAAQTLLGAGKNGKLQQALRNNKKVVEAEKESEDIGALREKAKNALWRAAVDGSLKSALKEETDEKEQTRMELRDLLVRGAASGQLHQVLQKVKVERSDDEQMRLDVRNAFVGASMNGRLKDVLNEVRQDRFDEKTLQQEARTTLLNATLDGSLRVALREVKQAKQEKEGSSLRLPARDTMVSAAADGRLQAALQQVTEMREAKALREAARDALLKGAADGRLQAALHTAHVSTEAEQLRQQACNTFLKASRDGRLQSALRQARDETPEDIENVRLEARDMLMQAARTGRFASALQAVREDSSDAGDESDEEASAEVEEMRQSVRSTLLKATHDGRLGSVLCTVRNEARPDEETPDQVEEMRQSVRSLLLQAALDGRLGGVMSNVRNEARPDEDEDEEQGPCEVLANIPPTTNEFIFGYVSDVLDTAICNTQADGFVEEEQPEADEVEELRLQTRDLFLNASGDGRLRNALEEVRATQHESLESDVRAQRVRAREILCGAALDGRLQDALTAAKQATVVDEEDNESEEEEEIEEVRELRLQALDTLMGAARDGRLRAALFSKEMSTEQLRQQAAEKLLEAASTNRLQKSLQAARAACQKQARDAVEKSLQQPPVQVPALNLDAVRTKDDLAVRIARAATQAVRKGAAKALEAESAAAATAAKEAAAASEAVSPSLPSARQMQSSKSRRRIIGGVVRSPSASEPILFHMEEALASKPNTPTATARDSSLTRGYEALGATEFFSMSQEHVDQVATSSRRVALPPPTPPKRAGMPRNHSASALMMDLGGDAASRGSSWATSSPSRSSSLGALSATIVKPSGKAFEKSSKGKLLPAISPSSKVASTGLLPSLSWGTTSSGSVAWSIHGSRNRLSQAF